MSFASDNWAPVHPAIMSAVVAANEGLSQAYGEDGWTEDAQAAICATFETECAAFLVPTGTAANCLGLAALTPPWGAILAHEGAHIVTSEAGGPEFFTGGARVLSLPGAHGKISAETLAETLDAYPRSRAHALQPMVISITQPTENGTVYTAEEIAALADLAHGRGLKLHMDGARFANACVALGVSAAELSWRAGVDALSFGATKNGALSCDAVIAFDPEAAAQLPHLRMRAGALESKHRFLAAQMCAYLNEGLWLSLAGHANTIAASLAAGLSAAGFTIAHPPQANQVFASLPATARAALQGAEIRFYPWPRAGAGKEGLCRFVASWANTADDVERAVEVARAAG
jgi:threonine aldolase